MSLKVFLRFCIFALMKFNIRKLNSLDYDSILVKWWKDWRWTAPPKDFLPENGEGGFIVYDNDIPVCAGYIYMTNSKVGWCDWIISNFEYKNKKKRKYISYGHFIFWHSSDAISGDLDMHHILN